MLPRHIVLVGPMGVGKTTIGTIVADRLGWPLVDSDRVIEAMHGKTGRDIVAADGVEELHRVEAEIFDEALGFAPPSVIAPAASVADDARLLDRMSGLDVQLVLLECNPAELAARAAGSRHRRRVDDGVAAKLMAARRAAVAPLAHLALDVTSLSPAAAADHIVDLVDPGN